MARPRQHKAKKSARPSQREDLSKLSTEVLRLRLQNLNLPITGSRSQLVKNLRTALASIAATTANKTSRTAEGRVTRPRSGRQRVQNTRTGKTRRVAAEPAVPPASTIEQLASDEEDDDFSDAGSSVEDLLSAPVVPTDTAEQLFTPAQLSAIQDTVSSSITAALSNQPRSGNPPLDLASSSSRSRHSSNVATPLGINRPLDKTLEDKILRGEYVDFALLLPDILYRPQSPDIQLRFEDSSPGAPGSPLTLVRKKKPVVDTFHKWLDTFTSYMLVIVEAYPRRSLELIKYQQIISKAVSKFKGMAWLSYDEQFRRRAAYDLSIAWDTIDLELWTVTFSGLAKPHCSVCSSPYHQQDECPSQDPSKKPRRPNTVCFDFNKTSGCQRRPCHYPHVCRRCGTNSHTLFTCPRQSSGSHKQGSSSDRSKK
ncbi:uncharacterized protein LOC144660935 [Oculina patagonica]